MYAQVQLVILSQSVAKFCNVNSAALCNEHLKWPTQTEHVINKNQSLTCYQSNDIMYASVRLMKCHITK